MPVGVSLFAFDALSAITCLVIGILGACSIMSMSTGLAFSLIGVGASIFSLYIAAACKRELWSRPHDPL